MLSGFTGIFSVLNGQTVYVEAVTMTTFMAVANGPLGTFSGLSGTATSLTGQFVGPNQGTVALSTSWLNPLNVYSPTAYASADTGASITDPIYPTTAANLSSPNTAWTSPSNAIAVGASVASVSLSIGGAPPPPPPPPPSGIVIVQVRTGGYGFASTSPEGVLSVSTNPVGFSNSTTVSNTLLCVVWADSDKGTPIINTPVTTGFTWVLAGTAIYSDTVNGEYGRVSLYYINNAAAMSGTTVVNAGRSLSTYVEVEFALYEFSGIVIASAIDVSATNTGNTSIPSTSSLVTTVKDLIFVSMLCDNSVTPSIGAGYTAGLASTTIASGLSQYIPNQAAGTIATAFGTSEAHWACVAVSFKAA
jgi:hypothetical protein